MKVLIVGGGPVGLAAALALRERGVTSDITVLEAAPRGQQTFGDRNIALSAASWRFLKRIGVTVPDGQRAPIHEVEVSQRGAFGLLRLDAREVGAPMLGAASPYPALKAAFDDAAFVAGQSRLQAYLQDADALMRYELASQAAGLLEQYVTYRPAWLQAWRDGDRGAPADADTAWQAALWQRLEAELGTHAPHPAEAFVAALQRGGVQQAQRAGLPARLHVFALPAIAPQHLHLLQQLAQHLDVQLYVLNPCREYWFDLVGRRRLSRLAAQGRATGLEEEGNPLLASWGKQAQVMLDALLDAGGSDDADFVPAPGTHLLAQLQNTLLELQPVAPGSLECAEGDRSIELHVCHSLTRELEVLHDHLLGLFAADHRLRPGDILVVTPDLEAAAPLIDAVFGTAPKERALPYALCGARRSRAEEVQHGQTGELQRMQKHD